MPKLLLPATVLGLLAAAAAAVATNVAADPAAADNLRTETVPVEELLDFATIEELVREFGFLAGEGARVSAGPDGRTLIVRATPEKLALIRDALREAGEKLDRLRELSVVATIGVLSVPEEGEPRRLAALLARR